MEYDWDNISVGEPALNTSDSYFFRGIKQEAGMPEFDFNDCAATASNPSEKQTAVIIDKQTMERYKQQQQRGKQDDYSERAYRYAQVYEEKRKVLREKETKTLQEMKKFHARPAPNFKQGTKKENVEPKFTIPVTPKQMKPERLKKATDQAKKMHDRTKEPEAPKFKAHEAKVLREEPFKPALAKTIVKPEPFNLRMSARLQERKQFDEKLQKAKAEKARREEEERRAAEERELKLMRKQKEFKANPNPFK